MDYYIGIDNGVTGSIGILSPNGESKFFKTPVYKEASYTKEEKNISRVDVPELRKILGGYPQEQTLVLLERPMVNPRRFTASMSALRALEATLIVIEEMGYTLRYVDSKEWQKVLLPKILGSEELKEASLELGKKLYPDLKFKSDADSILMAHWAKQAKL
jgi:hypothetical protein